MVSGDSANEPLGNAIEGKLVSITKNVWASQWGNKLQAVISIETEEGIVDISSNMHNEMRKLLLKIAQADNIEHISIALYYIRDASSGKRYFSTGVSADGVKLSKVDLDREAELAAGTMEKEVSKTGKVTWYYDNPLSETNEDLLGDPKYFDGALLERVSKFGEYEAKKAEHIAKEDVEEEQDPEDLPF